MKKAAFVVAAVALAVVLAGCSGDKAPSVPKTVATVNGQPIESSVYLDQISRRFGQDMLRNMIEQQIVLQWAKDEKVSPTDEQVSKQIELLKNDGAYDEQVKVLGEEGLKSEVKAMQARINLARKNLEVPEAELEQTYNNMKQRYVHPARKQVALIINQKKAEVEAARKQLTSGASFDEVAAEYSGQQYSAFRGPIKIWVEENQPGMPEELAKAAKSTKLGEVSKVLPLAPPGAPTQYALIKVLADQPKTNKSLKAVKAEVEDAVLMQKSQSDPDFVKKLNERMKDAKIDIKVDAFKNLVYSFKNPPEPPPAMMSQPQPAPAPKAAQPKK